MRECDVREVKVEKEAERKQVERGGVMEGREVRGGRGLSLLDVKSLRWKDGGDVHCSTCAGNRQCQQQHGDEGDKRLRWKGKKKT